MLSPISFLFILPISLFSFGASSSILDNKIFHIQNSFNQKFLTVANASKEQSLAPVVVTKAFSPGSEEQQWKFISTDRAGSLYWIVSPEFQNVLSVFQGPGMASAYPHFAVYELIQKNGTKYDGSIQIFRTETGKCLTLLEISITTEEVDEDISTVGFENCDLQKRQSWTLNT